VRIAAQLYTIREHTATRSDFLNSLRKLKDIGYQEVQLSAVGCMNGEVSPTECRAILDDLEMKAPLTHRPWEEIKDRTEECIEFHKTIGAELVAVGSVPGEYRQEGLDGYKRFVEDAKPAIAKLKQAGLMFAYHNHAFEFERMGANGETPFSLMAEGGLDFEIDTFWVVHAGIELVPLIQNLKGRLPMVHLKDLAPVGNEIRMAPVGAGNLNWPEILQALTHAGTILCAVEQDDCYGRDPFECLADSLAYLRSHGLG
jgi:sugar phosphate isomerase/epimerase